MGNSEEDLKESGNGSLEFLLNQAGFENALVVLRSLKETDWLRNRFVMRPMGYIEMNANWGDVMDAVFFIREMKPSHFR